MTNIKFIGFLCPAVFFLLPNLVSRIRNSLAQLYAKDIIPDDKQELDEALQREVSITVKCNLNFVNHQPVNESTLVII